MKDDKDLTATLVVPTMNEVDGMKWFISKTKKEWYDELIVIDGNSTDGTVEFCKQNGFPVHQQSGKGIPKAFADALKLSTKDIVVTTSPDGNSIPELLPVLTAKIREGFDLVIVSRYLEHAKSHDDDLFTGFGNKVFTWVINFLFRGRYTDTLVIYRAYRKEALLRMNLHRHEEENWFRKNYYLMNSWELGSSIRAAKMNLRVAEIPGDEPKRIAGVRKMSIFFNGVGVLLQIVNELVNGLSFLSKDDPLLAKKPARTATAA